MPWQLIDENDTNNEITADKKIENIIWLLQSVILQALQLTEGLALDLINYGVNGTMKHLNISIEL